MTTPGTDGPDSGQQETGAGRRSAPAPAGNRAAEVELLTFGHFRHRDPIMGHESDRYGVVFATGDVLRVAPIERYTVQVEPGEFTPVHADDVSGDDEP